ncbi:MAG: hypothetical protein J6D47_15080 [Peptostreptococcaceae bacterium]|nr:hypothetical protein [Peptostreptococcaceae bacterium]
MKFNKRKKIFLNIFIIISFLIINIIFIYSPMKEKEEDLNNIINKIEVSKKLINENNSNKTEKENLILKIEEYLKSESIIYYIKKESEEDERIVINLKFGGLSQSIIKLINNINNISNKIYLNNIELSRIDEKIIECKVRITMYTS